MFDNINSLDDLRKASGSPDFDKRFRTACSRYR